MSTDATVDHWKWYHTLSLTILSALTLGVAKSNEVFYDFYATSFGLTSRDYRYILISTSFGGFLSIFIGPFIKKNINNVLNANYNTSFLLIMIYGIFGALMCIIYPIPFTMKYINYDLIIIWNLIIASIQGLFLVLIATQIFEYANHCAPPQKKGIIISVLSISWPLCTLLNIIIGYLLNNNQTDTIFYSFGIAIIIQLFLMQFVIFPLQLKVNNNISNMHDNNNNSIKNQLNEIIGSRIAMSLLLIQFISCTSSGILNTTINGSWLKNIFHLNAFQIGTVSITLFFAEILGSTITGKLLDYNYFFQMYFMGVIIKLITGTFLIFFVYLFSVNAGNLITAIIIIFFMYFGWESVIVTQLYSYTYLLKHTNITFETMFNISTSFTYIGRIIGIQLTTLYWNNGQGLLILSILAVILFFVAILLRIFVYYYIKKQQSQNYDVIINEETDINEIDSDDEFDDKKHEDDEIKVLEPGDTIIQREDIPTQNKYFYILSAILIYSLFPILIYLSIQLITNYKKYLLLRCFDLIFEVGLLYICGALFHNYLGLKSNYTRKIVHITAYSHVFIMNLIFFNLKNSTMDICWSLYITQFGFIMMTVPYRNIGNKLCGSNRWNICKNMLDGIERTEDRPNVLKWYEIQFFLTFFILYIFSLWWSILNKNELILITQIICAYGDGLAEVIGVRFGKNNCFNKDLTYKTSPWFTNNNIKYIRSIPGSLMVLLFSYIAIIIVYIFTNIYSLCQFIVAMIIIPSFATITEAKSPHTMDQPFIIIIVGLLSTLCTYLPI